MCMNMYMEICLDMRIDMYMDMCIDICMDMCTDMCIDIGIDMCESAGEQGILPNTHEPCIVYAHVCKHFYALVDTCPYRRLYTYII